MTNALIALAYVVLIALPVLPHVRKMRRKEARARAAAERGKIFSDGPRGEHPRIDVAHCLGCSACVEACPEGEVLGVIAGKAAIVNGNGCIGHGLCAEACPVGSIEIVRAAPSIGADLPKLTLEFETSVPNLFAVGEMGGLALIRNAVNQGRDCVDTVTGRLSSLGRGRVEEGVLDLCVVGAGPAGISASLRALQNGISCVVLEQEEFGGTVAKFPRQKLVMTSPVEFPILGRFRKLEISKEELLELWRRVARTAGLKVNTCERVTDIRAGDDGVFTLETTRAAYRARAVLLAIGRRGTPRKLGIKGEELNKVMYSLIDADAYKNKNILVVGGGDSAVEAAMGLAHQEGNRVTLSYRRECFRRLKARNAQRIEESMASGRVTVLFRSDPVEIRGESVVLRVDGETREVPNDYVWVFAGGTPAREFLAKVGVEMGSVDLTQQAQTEAALTRPAIPDPAASATQTWQPAGTGVSVG
jgi:thioredoxin reductase (NADPH)